MPEEFRNSVSLLARCPDPSHGILAARFGRRFEGHGAGITPWVADGSFQVEKAVFALRACHVAEVPIAEGCFCGNNPQITPGLWAPADRHSSTPPATTAYRHCAGND